MKFSSSLSGFLLLLSSLPLSLAAPTIEKDWTFKQAFEFALDQGGPIFDNVVAKMIKRHVETNSLSWESEYDDNVYTTSGAKLILAPELRKRTASQSEDITQNDGHVVKAKLEKRYNVDITGYIWTNDCSGTNFRWNNVASHCHAFWDNGHVIRMYSLKMTGASNDECDLHVKWYRDDSTCGGGTTGTTSVMPRPPYCFASSAGRGLMSFKLVRIREAGCGRI